MTKRVIAIVMAKNEEHNIKHVLQSCKELVDAMFVLDTGSSDNTVALANSMFSEDMPGLCLSTDFKDFGTTRTKSFIEARKFSRSLGWSDHQTYGLLLDANQRVKNCRFDKEQLVHSGYSCTQYYMRLQYPNIRLIRFDINWRCIGVVHECWSGGSRMFLDTLQLEDVRTSNSISKQEWYRDLLMQGLNDEPKNSRYVFYLAQTLRGLGDKDTAIEMYKRRLDMGDYKSEIWFSLYQLSKLHTKSKDKIFWTLQAYVFDDSRAEALYHTAVALRKQGKMKQAYSLIKLAFDIPKPNSDLFIEDHLYDREIHKEMTILAYYGPKKKKGYQLSLDFLNKHDDDLVLRNLKFYLDTYPTSASDVSSMPDKITITGGKLFSKAVGASKRTMVNGRAYITVRIGEYYSIVNETDYLWTKLSVGIPPDINILEWFPV